MSWGTDLWDQYDNIEKHTQKGIEFCERISHFYRERCNIENDYARNLKLVRNHLPKKKEDADVFTATSGFTGMLNEIHDLAGQHEFIAESLQNEVVKDPQTFIATIKADRRKHLQDCLRLQNLMKAQLESLDRSKKKYERAFVESEKAQESFRKADADMNLSRGEVQKQKQHSERKSHELEDCKSDYANILEQTNHYQLEHYTQHMPDTLKLLQEMDERRIVKISECVQRTADVEKRIIPIINNCIKGMQEAGLSINASQDSRLVIDRYKSGFPIPEDIPFEDLGNQNGSDTNVANTTPSSSSSNQNNTLSSRSATKVKKKTGIFGLFGAKTDEQKEDFSDLPPNQQRKKLQQKIDTISKDIAKETAEREGILKMQTVYRDNPKLGEASSLDKKIEENAQKLDDLQQKLQKFKNFLVDAERGSKRSSYTEESLPRTASNGSVQVQRNGSAPGTPQPPHTYMHITDGSDGRSRVVDRTQVISQTSEDLDGDLSFDGQYFDQPIIGTARAIYSFDPTNEVSVPIAEMEEVSVLESDEGDGWTRIRKNNGEEGFVPTTYIEIHLYHQNQV